MTDDNGRPIAIEVFEVIHKIKQQSKIKFKKWPYVWCERSDISG